MGFWSPVIFCEAAAIYGVIVAIILGTKIESSEYTAVEYATGCRHVQSLDVSRVTAFPASP